MVREFLALPLNTAKASVRHFGWSLPQQQVPVPGRDGSIRCSLLLAVLQLNSQRHCRKGAVCTIDYDIIIKRLHTTFGCSGTVLNWFTSYLSFRTQSVFVGHASTPSALKCGVPQGSVLGPFLFTLYTQSLSTVICQSDHSYHFFADDSQFHNSSTPSDFPVRVHSLKDSIKDVAEWMCASMLKMNHDKTELIAIGTKPKISQVTLSLTPVSISGHNIPFSQSVRNLGVFIDETLPMVVYIKHLCRILFCQLRRCGQQTRCFFRTHTI